MLGLVTTLYGLILPVAQECSLCAYRVTFLNPPPPYPPMSLVEDEDSLAPLTPPPAAPPLTPPPEVSDAFLGTVISLGILWCGCMGWFGWCFLTGRYRRHMNDVAARSAPPPPPPQDFRSAKKRPFPTTSTRPTKMTSAPNMRKKQSAVKRPRTSAPSSSHRISSKPPTRFAPRKQEARLTGRSDGTSGSTNTMRRVNSLRV